MAAAVVGCVLPVPGPDGGWVKMADDHVTLSVGCNSTADVWTLTCRDGQWTGAIMPTNCTPPSNTGLSITH